MNITQHRALWGVHVTLLLCGLALGLSSCFGNIVTKWAEQVRLRGGRIIEIERRSSKEKIGPMGAGEARTVANRIRFRDPSFKEWQDIRDPILLELDSLTGDLVLICTSSDQRVWSKHGRPTPPYWQFRLRDGQWIEQPLDSVFFGTKANLIPDAAWLSKHRGMVTLEQKKRWFEEIPLANVYGKINRDSRFGMD